MIRQFLSHCFELDRLLRLLEQGFLARDRAKSLMVPQVSQALDLFERQATAEEALLLCAAHPIAAYLLLESAKLS
jgi:hypothetical protein